MTTSPSCANHSQPDDGDDSDYPLPRRTCAEVPRVASNPGRSMIAEFGKACQMG